MSDHFDSFLMNDVPTRLEADAFFADIGEERTLSFVQGALSLSRYHDGNPGKALAGVGQRLGICYYCWDRREDLRQGICHRCRAEDSIMIEPAAAEESTPREATISYAFIDNKKVREVLNFLPEAVTKDLDIGRLQKLPGNFIDSDTQSLREIYTSIRYGAQTTCRANGAPVVLRC